MTNKEIDSSIVRQTAICFDQIEILLKTIKQAEADRRYRWTLSDARFIREMIDDMSVMLDKAWLTTLDMKVDIDEDKIRQLLQKAMLSNQIENQDTEEQKALNGQMTYTTLEKLLDQSVIENKN